MIFCIVMCIITLYIFFFMMKTEYEMLISVWSSDVCSSDLVGDIKLGLEFFSANGRQGIRDMAELNLPIFLDLKFHDIPNTVAKAIQALRPLEPAILTVHAAGGRAMLEDAKIGRAHV